MGIPILYPWANRLSANDYGVDGAVVTLTPGTGGVRTDEHGVPIHGRARRLSRAGRSPRVGVHS